MEVARRFVGPLEPSFGFPVVVPMVVPMIIPVFVRFGPGHESEFMQRLLKQRDKTAYLPLPIFRGRPLIRFGH
jgi:hypothetical protein